MFCVKANRKMGKEIYVMELQQQNGQPLKGEPGQFYMLRVESSFMVLGRPLSIMDIQKDRIFFMYKVIGKGTGLLAKLREGDKVTLHGPYGRGYPVKDYENRKVALIGGGMGIAPLLYTAKRLNNSKLYLGLNSADIREEDQIALEKLFASYGDYTLYFDTDMTGLIDFSSYEAVMTCGPEIMMKKVADKHDNTYISMEKHMGCGVGACLSCTCEGTERRLKVCKDGPVFHKREVEFYA